MCYNGNIGSIGNLTNTPTNNFSTFIFTDNGSFTIDGISNVTFNNCGFYGGQKILNIKSFRNSINFCSFENINNAINTETGKNWVGENSITNCIFHNTINCINLNYGSDGYILNNICDNTCTNFINGFNDAGYIISHNHDYSRNGSTLSGYGVLFTNNYIDGVSKLKITGNGFISIIDNQFLISTLKDNNYCIKITNENFTDSLINNNKVTYKNTTKLDNLFFIDNSTNTFLTRVQMKNNSINNCHALLKEYTSNDITSDFNCKSSFTVNNSKVSLIESAGSVIGNANIIYIKANLNNINIAEIGTITNTVSNFIYFIKLDNNNNFYIRLGNNHVTLTGSGDYSNATSVEIFAIGIKNDNTFL